MGKTVALHVGDSLETVGARFTDAWKRAETGELHAGNAEVHLGFASWEAMVRVLSPKRLELLRHLHRHPSPNVRQLAAALGRDYRRVHEDVAALLSSDTRNWTVPTWRTGQLPQTVSLLASALLRLSSPERRFSRSR